MSQEFEPFPETIVAAAIFYRGKIYYLQPPARHHTVIYMMGVTFGFGSQTQEWEQGFLTSRGRFARRKPAFLIAERAGQLEGRVKHGPADTLFSEDLW